MKIKTHSDYNLEELKIIIEEMRKTFANVFARHYLPKLTHPGFEDLREKLFKNNLEEFSEQEKIEKLREYYFLHGFSDEIAYLTAWSKQGISGSLAELNPEMQKECADYLGILHKEQRELSTVGFIVLVDDEAGQEKVKSFLIYHCFKRKVNGEEVSVVHVRQAASANQKQEEMIVHVRQATSEMSRQGDLKKLLPELLSRCGDMQFECNRRVANDVIPQLANSDWFEKRSAVLGYSDKYESYLSKFSLRELMGKIMPVPVEQHSSLILGGP